MSTNAQKPMRADARRNRDAILRSAGELFAERGSAVQMDEIAEHSGLGMGILYLPPFPNQPSAAGSDRRRALSRHGRPGARRF